MRVYLLGLMGLLVALCLCGSALAFSTADGDHSMLNTLPPDAILPSTYNASDVSIIDSGSESSEFRDSIA
jgi:hypothetical protein